MKQNSRFMELHSHERQTINTQTNTYMKCLMEKKDKVDKETE